jgi:hypothetical protein
MRLLPAVTVQCTNCGAPLEFKRDATETSCRYCGATSRIERIKTAPPLETRVPGVVYVSSGGSTSLLIGISLAITALAGAAAAIANHSATTAAALTRRAAPPEPPRAPSQAPPARTVEPIRIEHPPATAASAAKKRASRVASTAGTGGKPTHSASSTPKAPPFDTKAAEVALNAARSQAIAFCPWSGTGYSSVSIGMGFTPDGSNRNARLMDARDARRPEGPCVLAIFRAVRVPPYDPERGPSGWSYGVPLRAPK